MIFFCWLRQQQQNQLTKKKSFFILIKVFNVFIYKDTLYTIVKDIKYNIFYLFPEFYGLVRQNSKIQEEGRRRKKGRRKKGREEERKEERKKERKEGSEMKEEER